LRIREYSTSTFKIKSQPISIRLLVADAVASKSCMQTSENSVKTGVSVVAEKLSANDDSDATVDWSDEDTASWLDENILASSAFDDFNNNDENGAVNCQPLPKKSKLAGVQ